MKQEKAAAKWCNLMFTLLALSLGFIGARVAFAAESVWTGGDSIVVGPGDTLRVNPQNTFEMVDSIRVESGGTLIILENYQIGVMRNFINEGLVKVEGSLTFNQDEVTVSGSGAIQIDRTGKVEVPENGFYLGTKEFKQLLEKGKIVVGLDNPAYREHGAFIQVGANGGIDTEVGQVELKTSQFIKDGDQQLEGTILMKDWSSIRTGANKAIITGDELHFGATPFSMEILEKEPEHDIQESRMSRFRGGDITLVPESGDTITLASGVLQSGREAAPGPNGVAGLPSTLKIGNDGLATLQIDGGALVLGGDGNDEGGQGKIDGNIIVGNAKSADINSAMVTRTGNWTMKGDLTVEKSGYLEVGNRYLRDDGQADAYLMEPATLDIDGVLTINTPFYLNYASVVAKTVKTGEEGIIEVRDSGTISANDLSMNGGQINFDPAFIAAGDTSNASMGGLNFASNNIDGRINVGQNSMVTLGSADPEWLRTQIGEYQTKTGNLWGRDITAALAVRSPQKLDSKGGVNVDGSWTSGGAPAKANKATFAANSLFVVDSTGVGNAAALDGNGTATLEVKPGAKLLVTDGAVGDSIIITDNFAVSHVSEDGWSANVTSPLQDAKSGLDSQGRFVVGLTESADPAVAFPLLVSELDAVLDTIRRKGLNTDSNSAGVRFISRAVDNRFIGGNDPDLAATTIESATRMAVVGAVPQMTLAANNAAGAAITQRTSMAQPEGILQSVDADGNSIRESKERFSRNFALWIMPLYQSSNGFGLEAGNLNYDFSGALGGVALGGDYTFDNMLRFGLAFNIGGGYARGSGDMNTTKNNMSFWGLGAYAGWSRNNFGLSADINYTSTYNKLKQDLPEQMRMKELKSDVTAWAISTGLRAEYKFETDYIDIIPHAGFRYINLNTDSYDIKSNGTVINGDSFTQNIWTIPLGLTFSKNIELENGWHFKPLVDFVVTPATGDIKAKNKIHFTGINQEAELDTKTMDYITYGGTAGIEFGNDVVSFGVNYNGQYGAETSAHGIFGSFRVEF